MHISYEMQYYLKLKTHAQLQSSYFSVPIFYSKIVLLFCIQLLICPHATYLLIECPVLLELLDLISVSFKSPFFYQKSHHLMMALLEAMLLYKHQLLNDTYYIYIYIYIYIERERERERCIYDIHI